MKPTCSRPSLLCVAAAVLALVSGLSARADSSYQSAVLGSGPVGYYRFAESGVSTVPYPLATNLGSLGAVANAADNPAESAIVKGVPGALADPANTAFSFPGANLNGLVVPYNAALAPSGPFTVEFWAKPATTNFACMTGFFQYTSPRYGWFIYQSGTSMDYGNGLIFRLYAGSGSTLAGDAEVQFNFDTTQWYHIAAVWDGATAKLYTNGVLAASANKTANYAAPPSSAGRVLTIGSRGNSGSSAYYEYPGLMDEYAFYGAALTPDVIAAHYGAATTNATGYAAQLLTSSPVGYWRLNETFTPPGALNLGSAGTALNAAYRNWCTTTNDLQLVAPGFPGLETTNTSLLLATNNPGYVRIPAPNLTLTSATFECFFKPQGEQSAWAGLVFDRDGNNTCGLNFNGNYTSYGSVLGYYWNNSASTYNFYSGLIPPDNQWVYAAVTITPSQAAMYMYDGTTWTGPVLNYASHGAATFNAPILVGNDSGAAGRFFNGQIDEVAIYTNALTEAQLRSHALSAFGGLGVPVILSGPTLVTSGDIFEGAAFSLTVDAYGAPPVSYQWLFSPDYANWSPITGATNATWTMVPTVADTGYYSVIVSNTQGSVKSYDFGSAAYVYVNPSTPPTLTQDPLPAARSVYLGGSCTFTAAATGPALHYQWKHAGTNLPGATSAALTVANVDATKTGSYQILVTNVAGSAPLSAIATLTLLPTGANSYEANVVADGPESYWRLNEASSGTIYDSMGRHDGTLNGSVSLAQPGVLGGGDADTCMYFTNGYVNVPYSADLNPTVLSVECWARLDDVPFPLASTAYYTPFASRDGNYDNGGLTKGYNLYADGPDGCWDFWMGSGGAAWNYVQGSPVQTNKWFHFVCTYDGVVATTYVNGAQAGSSGFNYTPNVRKPFTIGTLLDASSYQWKGPIDEVAFYKKVLSPSRIAVHYQLGVSGTNTAPVFVTQPVSRTNQVATSVSFTPTVVGATPMSYQWKCGGAAVTAASNLSLTFASVDYTNAGQYTLAVTNSYGGVVSATANLVVTPPASVTNLTARVTPGATSPKLELIWPIGRTLYYATDLVAPTWLPVAGATAPYYNVPIDPATPRVFFKIQ